MLACADLGGGDAGDAQALGPGQHAEAGRGQRAQVRDEPRPQGLKVRPAGCGRGAGGARARPPNEDFPARAARRGAAGSLRVRRRPRLYELAITHSWGRGRAITRHCGRRRDGTARRASCRRRQRGPGFCGPGAESVVAGRARRQTPPPKCDRVHEGLLERPSLGPPRESRSGPTRGA